MNKQLKIRHSSGISLMEVLITMIIILLGMLGIVALQGKAQIAELEAYQRAQALIILSDIVDKINVNRATAACFDITDETNGNAYLGDSATVNPSTDVTCTASTAAYNTQAINALNDINNLLIGTNVSLNSANVGAMIGARACISYDDSTELDSVDGTGLYTVIVTWQGTGDLFAPTGMNCANNTYGAETRRRAVASTFRMANLY